MNCPHCGKEIFDMGRTIEDLRADKKIPEGALELMVNYLSEIKKLERMVGMLELAYRRGKQEGEEGANP